MRPLYLCFCLSFCVLAACDKMDFYASSNPIRSGTQSGAAPDQSAAQDLSSSDPGSPGGPNPSNSHSSTFPLAIVRMCNLAQQANDPRMTLENATNPIISLDAVLDNNTTKQRRVLVKAIPIDKAVIRNTPEASDGSPMPLDFTFDAHLIERLTTEEHAKSIRLFLSACNDSNHNGFCSDEAPCQFLDPHGLRPVQYDSKGVVRATVLQILEGRPYDKNYCSTGTNPYSDPLILDLDGNGIVLTTPDKGVDFDVDAVGTKVRVSWTDPNRKEAFLALDLNKNGIIDNGSELFGNATVLKDKARAANGFQALEALDTNHNGAIDPGDAQFSDLRLWLDSNHNGITDAGELSSLSDWDIIKINLQYKNTNQVVKGQYATRQYSFIDRIVAGVVSPFLIVDFWLVEH